MILLSDSRISLIHCIDSNEQIISLKNVHENIIIDESRSQIASKSDFFFYARESVLKKLIDASQKLPKGYKFLIKEAYRPLSQQRNSFNKVLNNNRILFPDLSDEKLLDLTCQYVAPINVAGHPTGGAFDITLTKDGLELDMGTAFNAEPAETENRTFLESPLIKDAEKENRRILSENLSMVGFVNYPSEWWHWSYGDRYWAFHNNCNAIYSPIEECDIKV